MGNTSTRSISKRPAMGRKAGTSGDLLQDGSRGMVPSPRRQHPQSRRRGKSIDTTTTVRDLQDDETKDQILDFITSIKNDSKDGDDLLREFVQRQLGNSGEFAGMLQNNTGLDKGNGGFVPPSVITIAGLRHSPGGKTAKSA